MPRMSSFRLIAVIVLLALSASATAEVYVNMLWDDQLETFKVQPLFLEGQGITLDRNYQNAYGELLDLPPGPPFIVQAPIHAVSIVDDSTGEIVSFGSVTIESGGLGIGDEPFTVQFIESELTCGLITCEGPLNIIGSSWDPITFSGAYKIFAGHSGGADPYGSGAHSINIQNVEFNGPPYSYEASNYNPIQFYGGHVTIENCQFQGFGNDLGDIISYYENNSVPFEPVYDFSLINCRFGGNSTNSNPVSVDNIRAVTLNNNHFVNNTFSSHYTGGMVEVIESGIRSIRNNTASGNSHNVMRFTEPIVQGACRIKTDESLPMVSTGIMVGKDSSLAIESGSLIKFYPTNGGIRGHGRVTIDGALLTSYNDDEFGGDSDLDPSPAYIDHWNAGSGYNAGIDIDSSGSLTITGSHIRYAEGGVRAQNDAAITGCRFEYCNGFGLWFGGHATDTFFVEYTTIAHTTTSGYPAKYGVMLDNSSGGYQKLTLDGVSIYDSESHGVYLLSNSGSPADVIVANSKILNCGGDGIRALVSPDLNNLHVSNCLFIGNSGAGLNGVDNYGNNTVIEVDNCVFAGNGTLLSPRHGAIISSGIAKFIGNTAAYNNQAGVVFSQLDESQSKAINNIFYKNGSYGYSMGDYSQPVLSYNAFWENDEDVYEIYFRGPDGVLRTVEDVQALGGDYATNQHINPIFKPEITGSILSVAYLDSIEQSIIVTSPGTFGDRNLRHAAVNPDTVENAWYWCVWNRDDTVSVLGDITSVASAGDVFRVFDPHLTGISPMVDAGNTDEARGEMDFERDARKIDGDENGSVYVDIGGDEFETDSVKIRITSPMSDAVFRPGDVCEIEWTADYVDTVEIAYWPHVDSMFVTLEAKYAAETGSYTWTIPDDILASRCKVILMDIDGLGYAESDYFTVKDYILTRYDADSMYEVFSVTRDDWQFSNGDVAALWPPAWWSTFDYENGIDPYTGKTYPFYFAASWIYNARPQDFPDWPVFVSAFGANQCYINTPDGPVHRPSAVAFWANRKKTWNGSCFGLANLNLLAFNDTAQFKSTWTVMAPFDSLHDVTINDDRRKIINQTWVKQFGVANMEHSKTAFQYTAIQTLEHCRQMLGGLSADSTTRAITLCDFTSNPNLAGCHTITPYKCSQDDVQPEIWRILVYDNNYPGQTKIIEIDTIQNTWAYSQFGWSGTRKLFLEDPIKNYLEPAELPGASDSKNYSASTGNLNLFIHTANSVLLESDHGVVSQTNDSLYSTVTGVYPVMDKSGHTFPPSGYVIPVGDWDCRFRSLGDTIFRVGFFRNGQVSTFARPADTVADSCRMQYVHSENAVWVYNPDASSKEYTYQTILMHADSEIVCGVGAITVSAGDSIKHTTTSEPGLLINNFGSSAAYIAEVSMVGASVNLEFADSSMTVPANTGHKLMPTSEDLAGDSLKILIDTGNDGVFDDSIYASNNIIVDAHDDHGSVLPYQFQLSQNYPNPFNPVTVINYTLPRKADVRLEIFNILGQEVTTLVDETQPAGEYQVEWRGVDSRGQKVASGLYFYRFRAGDYIETKKMMLLK